MQNPIFRSKQCVFDIQGKKGGKTNIKKQIFFSAAERLAEVIYVCFGMLTNLSQEFVITFSRALLSEEARDNPISAPWRVLWSLPDN